MRRSTMGRLLALALSAAACSSDSSSSRDFGTVVVTIVTTGPGKDLDGYLLHVEGQQPRRVPYSGAAQVVGLAPGTHTVELQDIADNCELGSVLDPVTIVTDSTTTVNVSIDCHLDLHDRIVFTSSQFAGLQIMAMRPDGSQRFRVIESDSQDSDPDVTQDGQSMVFSRYTTSGIRLRVLNLSTGVISALPSEGLAQFRPEWSPDGSKVAFMVVDSQSLLIWVMDADGGNRHAVSSAPGTDIEPNWSPDGNWILYGHYGNLFRVSPAGGTPVGIPCAGGCLQASYSPDGQKIIYTGNSNGPPVNQDIYRMDADGGNVESLTTGSDNDQEPVWSPDGTSIVFTRNSNNDRRLFRLDLDGSVPVNISAAQFDQTPDWGPASGP